MEMMKKLFWIPAKGIISIQKSGNGLRLCNPEGAQGFLAYIKIGFIASEDTLGTSHGQEILKGITRILIDGRSSP